MKTQARKKVDAATEKVRAAIEGLAAVEGATETPSTTDKATQTGQETTTTTAAKNRGCYPNRRLSGNHLSRRSVADLPQTG